MADALTAATRGAFLAPIGVGGVMLVLLQEKGEAGVPLNVIVLATCRSPKRVAVRATGVPMIAEHGEQPVMTGITRKDFALLDAPFTVTITSTKPGAKLLGTGATIFVSLQRLGIDAVPPKVTVLLPWVDPKPVPLIVTDPPTGLTGPTVGDMLVMLGADCA